MRTPGDIVLEVRPNCEYCEKEAPHRIAPVLPLRQTDPMNKRTTFLTVLVISAIAVSVFHPAIAGAQDRDLPTADSSDSSDAPITDAPAADDGVDWEAIKETAPEDWTDEQKAQLEAAGYDLQAIAERVRHHLRETASRPEHDGEGDGDDARELREEIEEIGREIREAIARGELTPEEGRARFEAAREHLASRKEQDGREGGDDRLAMLQRRVIAAAMASPPEQWSPELQDAIVRAGWDLEQFTEGIRKRQAHLRDGDRDDGDGGHDDGHLDTDRDGADLSELNLTDTAIEDQSWGGIKAEVLQSK